MGKFSDPNYKLLSDYFDILVAVRSGSQKSFLIGPNKTVVSEGGLWSILYEDNATRGFVGHRFKIKEITGNRFKMTYEGLESTFSVASSAFEIGNEMYFRKDSFFHYWLARPEQDDLFHDYANQEKTFMFFGKIWPISNEVNTYSIEFEGLKDFTLGGLPAHNQTINMAEWLKVYFDQIHHEMYNMTKNFWSMFDAKEIDLRWIGYIANTYGIEISESILNELPLREWVENLPYFLKRVGTYNALYIIYKVFLSNTRNKLNVFERWGEWCVQNIDDIVDDFVDYHFLEFYGIQPSGGAGDVWYSQYDPSDYPVHALQSPTEECGTYKWTTGFGENYLLFQSIALNCSIGDIKEKEINITDYDPQRAAVQTISLSGNSFDGDFVHSTGIQMDSSLVTSNVVFWALSNEVAMMYDHTGNYLSLSFEVSGGSRYFKLTESYSPSGTNYSTKTSYAYLADTSYYLIVDRTGTTLRARVYSKERRWIADLVETISLTLHAVNSYSIIYALNGRRIPTHNSFTGKILGLSIDNVNYTATVAASGFPVITPHYKVEIDLSTEPLGDLYEDQNFIISENLIDELVRNWEYVRPVSKYAHYQELIAPKGIVDRVGNSIPLYDLSFAGYFNTFFTGSQYISAGGSGAENTYSHYQSYASKTWTVTHNLNSPYVLVQPWIFTSSTSQGAKLVQPDTVLIGSNNTVQLTFNESVRGVATVAGSTSVSGVSFIEEDYLSSPSDTWNIDHNLNSNTPSGYTSPPGPVVFHYDTNGYRIVPADNDMVSGPSNDSMETTFGQSVSGASIVRRSDYIHTQNDPENIWTVNHRLNGWVIVQCYGIAQTGGEDILYKEITPKEIEIIDQDNLKIYWTEDINVRGYAHIIQILRNQVIYSPYECDVLGVGMCPEVLGYWKVGTGDSEIWNPYVQNDLETPVASGTYKAIYEDLNNVYIDFEVSPEVADIGIKEVGLFNYLDQLIFYSNCSELFKPTDVNCFFHYRIVKIESSSSSSSSSSVSSSSSQSSSSSSTSTVPISAAFDVLSGTDDGFATSAGAFFDNTGHVTTGSIAVIGGIHGYFRFDNVTIPSSATILSCILRFSASSSLSVSAMNVIIHCEDADDPLAPSGGADLIGRSLTTGTAWNNVTGMVAWNFNNDIYESTDFTPELQTVIDRGGYLSGQAVTVHIVNDPSSDEGATRNLTSFDHATFPEAQLVVTYSL